MMRKVMRAISQPSVPKENTSGMRGEMALAGPRARLETTRALLSTRGTDCPVPLVA